MGTDDILARADLMVAEWSALDDVDVSVRVLIRDLAAALRTGIDAYHAMLEQRNEQRARAEQAEAALADAELERDQQRRLYELCDENEKRAIDRLAEARELLERWEALQVRDQWTNGCWLADDTRALLAGRPAPRTIPTLAAIDAKMVYAPRTEYNLSPALGGPDHPDVLKQNARADPRPEEEKK